MKAYHYKDIENQDVPEPAEKVKIRWLINEKQGAPNFAMRRFEVEPGGSTPYHTHPWEHEVYVLAGQGEVRFAGGSHAATPGDFAFVPPNDEHQFVNVGDKPFEFLCMVPLNGEDG